jgi:hypothetical protein
MAGDISRSSFNQGKHFSGVRMQQGRVQTDADWNEQVDIAQHFTRTAALDLIGPYGAPVADAGFGITAPGGVLTIGAGRMYVNGILCENGQEALVAPPVPAAPSGGSGPGPGGEGDPGMDAIVFHPAAHAAPMKFSPHVVAPPPAQPDLPDYTLPTAPGDYTVYLDVWERDITALEDPSILEIALGGIDTTTRSRVVWQVKLMEDIGCQPDIAAWMNPSTGMMEAQAQPNSSSSAPCAMPAQAGYSSLENQLYRIEVHTPGDGGEATFKWSRDNASVAAGWVSSPASDEIVVTTLGKDQTLSFQGGDWIELTDDTHELFGLAGTLVQLSNAQMVGLSPTLYLDLATASGPTGATSFPVNPKVRRWDQVSTSSTTLTDGAISLTEGSWLEIENGVQVQFTKGGNYNTGDYWLIPARTATVMSTPAVIWPTDSSGNPISQPNLGIWHSYAPLAIVNLNATTGWSVLSDCRLFFSPQSVAGAMHVISAGTLQPPGPLLNDSLVSVSTLLNGIKITCDQGIDPATIKLATLTVLLDTPVYSSDSASTGQYPAATPLRLLANYATGDSGNVSAFWIPTPETRAYVLEQMAIFAAQTMNNGRALVNVTLKGNFISAQASSSTLLNGPAYGTDDNGEIILDYPSGDGERGGDFNMFFWVPGYCDPGFPAGFIPFTSYSSIAGPDSSGDYVVVGEMSPAAFEQMQELPDPDTNARKVYCSPIQIAPGLTVIAYVPTLLERGGNFSTFGSPIIDPTGGGQFPGNVIPASEQPFEAIGLFVKEEAVPAKEETPAQEIHPEITVPTPIPIIIQPGGGTPISDSRAGVFAWRIRGKYVPPSHYGYGYGYGYSSGIGVELI